MPKFYVTDGDNRYLIDTNGHIQACKKAIQHWNDKDRKIGEIICFSNNGFTNIGGINCIETKIIRGLDFTNG